MKLNKHVCANCGRQGQRGYTYTIKGVYICNNKNACLSRKRKAEDPTPSPKRDT